MAVRGNLLHWQHRWTEYKENNLRSSRRKEGEGEVDISVLERPDVVVRCSSKKVYAAPHRQGLGFNCASWTLSRTCLSPCVTVRGGAASHIADGSEAEDRGHNGHAPEFQVFVASDGNVRRVSERARRAPRQTRACHQGFSRHHSGKQEDVGSMRLGSLYVLIVRVQNFFIAEVSAAELI